MTVVNTAPPVISGTLRQGRTLSATSGSWTFDLDYLTYDYQWERCDASGANCVDIAGAIGPTYLLTASDVGHEMRVRVEASEHTNTPPPPPLGDPYFDVDYSSGQFESPWVDLYSYTSPGFFAPPRASTPDGRVSVVADPAGGPGKAARVEIRDSDPSYPPIPAVDKSEITTDATNTWDGSFSVGTIRWFSWRIYLPYNGTEKFEWAHGGSQPYTSLWGLHPPGGTGYSAIHLGWEAWQIAGGDANQYLNFHIEGGLFPETTHSEIINLLQLTDGSSNRILANHNRWIDLVWGMKFNPDNTGWIEAWVDGVNVYPRKNRPTMWTSDGQNYFKYGLYNRHDASYPVSGKSVVYFGRTTIGYNRPF